MNANPVRIKFAQYDITFSAVFRSTSMSSADVGVNGSSPSASGAPNTYASRSGCGRRRLPLT